MALVVFWLLELLPVWKARVVWPAGDGSVSLLLLYSTRYGDTADT